MSLSCLVIEDDLRMQQHIVATVGAQIKEISTLQTASTLEEASQQLTHQIPDLVISDINLHDEEVFSLFKTFSSIPFKIIFITSYSKYAAEAFKFSALDFLEKPFDDSDLISAVNNAIAQINLDQYNKQLEVFFYNFNSLQKNKKLVLKNVEAVHIVPVAEILYLKSDNNYTEFHTVDARKIVVSKPLKQYHEQLKNYSFFRSHQSYLVNLNFAKTFHKTDSMLALTTGQQIPVAGSKSQALLHKLAQID
ncbi:MAG TPA: response regulator transcription factor [Flavobacteriaceae bacterium]|nr:response regulator transcription factor [Flavobacteriaceae bacterium]HIN99070.1 response regulator transcription factor [Flavobacteriaceae bacterium]